MIVILSFNERRDKQKPIRPAKIATPQRNTAKIKITGGLICSLFVRVLCHDVQNGLVGGYHAFVGDAAEIAHGFVHICPYDSIARLKSEAFFSHIKGQKSVGQSGGDFLGAGALGAVAHQTAHRAQGVG